MKSIKTIKYWDSNVLCIQNTDIKNGVGSLCKRGGLTTGMQYGEEKDTKLCQNCKREYIKKYGEDALFAELL